MLANTHCAVKGRGGVSLIPLDSKCGRSRESARAAAQRDDRLLHLERHVERHPHGHRVSPPSSRQRLGGAV